MLFRELLFDVAHRKVVWVFYQADLQFLKALQIFLQYHGGGLKTKAGCLSDGSGNGVDLKTDGGIAVVPPSIHPSGRRYEWIEEPTDDLANIATWPSELIEILTPKKSDRKQNKIKWTGVTKGKRNDTLASRLGHLVKIKGISFKGVLEIARGMNSTYKPPLPDEDVVRIVKSIWGREASKSKKSAEGPFSTTSRMARCAPGLS